ncbi:MAG: hypothetical protein L0211_02135 [Planctomycetaceae bacterium]|nr:hypothetical protein [Planctomycetaceae bacterium]
MHAFLESLTWWLVDFLVLSTALLALSLAVRVLCRQPGTRLALGWATWLGIAAIAIITALPAWPRAGLDDIAARWQPPVVVEVNDQPEASLPPAELPIDVVAHAEPIFEDSAIEPIIVPTIEATSEPTSWPLRQVAVIAWLASAGLGLAWILAGLARTRRLLGSAAKAPQWVHMELIRIVGARRLPGLWASERVSTAVALGALRPQIVVPQASVAESNSPAIRAALAHEWAHIRHGDLWLLALERLLLPLLAVHPLFWWLRRSVRLDQELLADAAAAGDERMQYAEALVAWARSARPSRHGLAAIGLWENPNTLSRRVAMILDAQRPLSGHVSRLWMAAIALLLAPVVIGLSLVTLRPLAAQDKPAPAADEADVVVEPEANPLVRRRYREIPGPAPKAANVPVTQVQMELLVMSIHRDKLAAADTTLEDAIAQATESRCRREAGLVVSEIKPEEVVKLLDGLKKHNAVEVISRPSVLTLDGREANVHIGGEAPILSVEETINGRQERRVEFKEFGTMLMVRPKLSGEKADLVTLDIVAEQSNLVPPGEKAVEGAVPRDVPGLVSHKFKLVSDVKLGGSLLVAESPADKKQLRDAVKEQFLLIVTPKRAVRTVAAVYADPREGEKGEAARAATEAALNAATAAEPEPGTASAALLKAERDARAKETAELRKQIEALQRDLDKLRAATETKLITREYPLKHREAREVAADLSDLMGNWVNKDRVQLTVDARDNTLKIQVVEKYAADIDKLIAALDRLAMPLDPNNPVDAHAQQLRKTLAERRMQRVDLGKEKPLPPPSALKPATDPPTRAHAQQVNWGELTADVAEARLDFERAEKEFARVEQLKSNGAISAEQVDQKKYELEKARIQLQRAEARLYAPALTAVDAASTPATVERGGLSQATELRLLELDLAEAKLAVEVAETEFQYADEIRKKNPGAISETEIRKYRLQADRARIQMERIKVKLEAAKEPQRAVR